MSQKLTKQLKWWARAWLEKLLANTDKARKQRGYGLYEQGAVRDLVWAKGSITARVRSTSYYTYEVALHFKQFTDRERQQVLTCFHLQPDWYAELLAGRMPFRDEAEAGPLGISLVPAEDAGPDSHCSCPDGVKPCKHIIAVYYAVSQAFSREPLQLFGIRGLDQAGIREQMQAGEQIAADLPEPELGGAFLRKAAENGTFWSTTAEFDQVEIQLDTPLLAPDCLPLLWGEPEFLRSREPSATMLLTALMRLVSERANVESVARE